MKGREVDANAVPLQTEREPQRTPELYWAVRLWSGHVIPPSVPFDKVDPRLTLPGSSLTPAPFPPGACNLDTRPLPPPPRDEEGRGQAVTLGDRAPGDLNGAAPDAVAVGRLHRPTARHGRPHPSWDAGHADRAIGSPDYHGTADGWIRAIEQAAIFPPERPRGA